MKVLLSCLAINGAVASIEEAILDDFDMDFDFGDELEFGQERFLNDEDVIGGLILEGAGSPVAGDIDGDGVVSASEQAMLTAEQWNVEGVDAFRHNTRRRNKRCDTCCPAPLFYYSIESIGKWEYDSDNADGQEVPPILNFPDTAKTAYGNWYDAAGFQSAMTPKTGSPDMTRCLCMRPLPQDQCDRAAGEQCDIDDSYKVQRGNCDPQCMDSNDRWTCEHNAKPELKEAEDSIPYVADVAARMRFDGMAGECLPPLPVENENGVQTCAQPWVTKGQTREHPETKTKMGYAALHDMLMTVSYRLNGQLTTEQLKTVGLTEGDRITEFDWQTKRTTTVDGSEVTEKVTVRYSQASTLANEIDLNWFMMDIVEGYWIIDATGEWRRDDELQHACIEPTPQAKFCWMDSGSFTAQLSGAIVGVAGVLAAFYLI